MSQLLDSWGLTWGVHSNNHFDITLAAFAQVGAAAVGEPAPLDTHWIWQEGLERLTRAPLQIVDGCINLPVDKAKLLYEKVYKGMPVLCHN